MRTSYKALMNQSGLLVIDGSMSTALERMGANLNSKLWTAKALANTPELVKQVHIDYFNAGADCGITCSYQATIPGLTENGFTEDEAREIIVRSVTVFLEAREEWWEKTGKAAGRAWPLCLAGIGPYGAYLADGSEYRGDYKISDEGLREFHKERMELLWNAGADVLLIETQPSLREALIEAELAEEMGADYLISFSCKDGKHINDGTLITECVKQLKEGHPHLQAIGVNCTKPEYVESLIYELKKASDLPVIVYPNSGEEYDAVTKTWHGTADAKSFEEYALSYYQAGADAVGGCCTTVGSHIAQVASARETFRKNGSKRKIHS